MDCNNCENFKPTTGRLINTAYDMGDTFWTMVKNVPVKVSICKISVNIDVTTYSERYSLEVEGGTGRFYDMRVEDLNKMCRTKEELMKKVFG